MVVHIASEKYFGVFPCDETQTVLITNGLNYAFELFKLHEMLKNLNKVNIKKAIMSDEIDFILKYEWIVFPYKRMSSYKMEFPLHRVNTYIYTYFKIVDENEELFKQALEAILKNSYEKPVFTKKISHSEDQTQMLRYVANIKEPLLKIFEKLKAAFQNQSFKDDTKGEQKYLSKMKVRYSNIFDNLYSLNKGQQVCSYHFYTKSLDFDPDNLKDGNHLAHLQAILDNLRLDRGILIDLVRRKFKDSFVGCIWKLNHNMTKEFYLSLTFFMNPYEKVGIFNQLDMFLHKSLIVNKYFNLIQSKGLITNVSNDPETSKFIVLEHIVMDSIFNLKFNEYRALGWCGKYA